MFAVSGCARVGLWQPLGPRFFCVLDGNADLGMQLATGFSLVGRTWQTLCVRYVRPLIGNANRELIVEIVVFCLYR